MDNAPTIRGKPLLAGGWSEALPEIVRGGLNARSRRMLLALLLIWILTVFDLVMTLLAHRIGGFRELNPIARMLLDFSEALIAYKLLTVAGASIIFYRLRSRWTAEVACWLCCGAMVVLSFMWLQYYVTIY